jgi:hypothetical protein
MTTIPLRSSRRFSVVGRCFDALKQLGFRIVSRNQKARFLCRIRHDLSRGASKVAGKLRRIGCAARPHSNFLIAHDGVEQFGVSESRSSKSASDRNARSDQRSA